MELEDTGDLGEDSVRVCGAQFENVTGAKALENCLKPWRGRVVSVSTKDGQYAGWSRDGVSVDKEGGYSGTTDDGVAIDKDGAYKGSEGSN